MPHEIKYKIHTVTQDMVDLEATIHGKVMPVKAPVLTIEAVHEMQGHTFRLFPDDVDKALKEFAEGNTLTVTLSGGKK